jgi:outer membrane protein insertion porin family
VTTGAGCVSGCRSPKQTRSTFGGGVESNRIKCPAPTSRPHTCRTRTVRLSSNSVPLTIGWSRDGRDSALAPNNGVYQRLNTEWSVAGDARYLQRELPVPAVHPAQQAVHAGFQWGRGLGQGPSMAVPSRCSRTSTRGGLGSVRGFDQGTLGPRRRHRRHRWAARESQLSTSN